jgi:hypothetical protein
VKLTKKQSKKKKKKKKRKNTINYMRVFQNISICGKTLANTNEIQDEITERIKCRNACCYSIHKLLLSPLLWKTLRVRICKVIVYQLFCITLSALISHKVTDVYVANKHV